MARADEGHVLLVCQSVHHGNTMRIAEAMAVVGFIFSTSSAGTKSFHRSLRERMIKRGFDVVGEFCCKGFMDYSFTKYLFGGLNRGRPNEKDLHATKEFALRISDGASSRI